MGFIILMFSVAGILFYLAYKLSLNQKNVKLHKEESKDKIFNEINPEIVKTVGSYDFMINKEKRIMGIAYTGVLYDFTTALLNLDSISDIEIVVNDVTIKESSISRAIVGGILAGGAGAIIGSNTAKQKNKIDSIVLKIITKDIDNPVVRVDIYKSIFKEPYDSEKLSAQLEDLVVIIKLLGVSK